MKGRRNNGQFRKGSRPWNTGTKGVRKPNRGCFQPGQVSPHKQKPLGDTYLDRQSGELFVKVAERHPWFGRPTRYKPRRLVVFEAAHGPVPSGCAVIRLLPDLLNDDLDNLVLVTRGALALLNRGHWHPDRVRFRDLPHDREIRLAAVAAAVVKARAFERARESRQRRSA